METCKSGSEGGCRKPVAYAIRRLCPTQRPAAKLHGYNHACKLGVCGTLKAGEHGQFTHGRGNRRVGGAVAFCYQHIKRNGAYEMRQRGNPV